VPAGVRSLLKRCLERDRKARIPDVSAVRFLLQDALSTSAAPEPAPPGVTPAASVWKRVLPAAVTGVAAAAVAVGVMWYLRPVSRQPITRFQVTLPDGVGFSSPGRRLVAFSPDGSQLVYVAGSRLNLRPMSDVEATTIRGTEALTGVSDPAFSPDGTSIAFYAGSDRSLKRISVTGGTAVTLCTIDGSPFGLTWAEDGVLFGQAGKGIMRLPTNGGSTPEVIVALKGDEMAYGPQMLPGGDRVLFTLATGLGVDRWDRARIVVQSLSSGQRTSVVEPGSDARYLPSGHLLYAVSGTVFAVGFDHRRLAATSAAVPVIEGVRRSTSAVTGAAHFALSSTGTLAYVPGPVTAEGVALDLGLADRQGNVQLLKLPPGGYVAPRVSPDGTRVAFGTDNGKEAIIYVRDVAGASAMRRLTFGGNNRYPVWSSDGTRIAYQSDRNGAPAVFWQMADGTGPAEALTTPTAGEVHSPESWSPKHDRFLFSIQKGGASSLWVYSLQQRKAVAFGDVQSVNPPNAVFSYDGKWVAYSATVQGRTTVYVQPDPPTGATYQLYAPPGNAPHEVTWSSDGTELFYNPRPSAFEAVKVTTAPTFAFGNPTIIPKQFQLGPPSSWRNYDVMPDGRFLGVFTPGSGGGVSSFPNEIRVVLNWLEDLKARVK
jgi:serine/threonine-protein kinase